MTKSKKAKEEENERTRKAKRVNTAYKKVFSSEHGQIVLEDLMLSAGIISGSSYVPGDPHQTSFNEGRREVVNRIIESINIDPTRFMKIVESATDQGEYEDEDINF